MHALSSSTPPFAIRGLISTGLLLSFSNGVFAQNTTPALAPNTNSDETMVVVGSRTPTQISQIPGAVWVIDKEMLQQQTRNGADLKTALGRLVPGLDLAPQGRTNYGQNMRGRGVQVLIDGVSLNSSRGLSRQFDAIDPFNIERVEVLSGASSLYGGGGQEIFPDIAQTDLQGKRSIDVMDNLSFQLTDEQRLQLVRYC